MASYSSTAEFFENSGILVGINPRAIYHERLHGALDTMEAAIAANIQNFDYFEAIKILAKAFNLQEIDLVCNTDQPQ